MSAIETTPVAIPADSEIFTIHQHRKAPTLAHAALIKASPGRKFLRHNVQKLHNFCVFTHLKTHQISHEYNLQN